MNGLNKEDIIPPTCKNHNARLDREFRICPSKLSKRELEDLYFTLLENNLELKKTTNNQLEKIKLLTTKVHRMTALQKNYVAKDLKGRSAHTKVTVNNHEELISNLKDENERLSEKIRILNMRLCSAKQFSRHSSAMNQHAYQKCSSVAGKNSLMSVIHSKTSNNNRSATVSSQCLDKDFPTSRKSVDVDGNEEENPEKLCNENKCRTLMEELKQKIADLQVELTKAHDDYTGRVSRLELEVAELHKENHRIRSECAASEYSLEQRELRAEELARRLRASEAQCGELAAQLSIEKRKVAEFETRVKAIDMSRSVAKTIDDHLTNVTRIKSEIIRETSETVSTIPYLTAGSEQSVKQLQMPSRSRRSDASTDMNDQKMSDDSGYIDASKSHDDEHEKAFSKLNEDLMERINDLQKQLTVLKMSAIKEELDERPQTSAGLYYCPPANSPAWKSPTDSRSSSSPADSPAFPPPDYSSSNAPPSCSTPNVGFDNADIKMTPKKTMKLDLAESAASASGVTRARLEEAPLDSSDIVIYEEEIINAEKNYIADSKKHQQVNSDLEMDISKGTISSQKIRESHNSYKIPGPVPVDKKTRKKIDKIAASKFKQLIDANKSRKEEHKISEQIREQQKQINISGDQTIPTGKKKENNNPSADESTKPISFKKKLVNMDAINDDDTRRKSLEDDMIELSEKSLNDVKSQMSAARNVSDFKDKGTAMVEDELMNKALSFGPESGATQLNKLLTENVPDEPFRRRSVTYTKVSTYSVPRQCSRATSPDNTDHEISSLSDLPSEKDGEVPRTLSPGEDNSTTTYTDSYTAPTTDYGSLSEGELPATGRDHQSLGETNFRNIPSVPSQRLEEALKAVSEDLVLCRALLMSQREVTII